MAELCAFPGTGPSHGYIGQRPEICREASESIVTYTWIPPAWDVRMEHRDEQQNLDVSILPTVEGDSRNHGHPGSKGRAGRGTQGSRQLMPPVQPHSPSSPWTSIHPAAGVCREMGGRAWGQSTLSPPLLEMSTGQKELHRLDLNSRRQVAIGLITPQLWAPPGHCWAPGTPLFQHLWAPLTASPCRDRELP